MNSVADLSPYLILGTAGHIDHGKTTLVKALTGRNTDRLPEEQKRGITIELGFAHLSCPPFEFGIVDVPGHQRFVRTMLAGSTGVDLVMLVVAGDDSINRQTREHLDILKFLDIPAGVIVLTKCDKVDTDWLDLVEQEVRDLVADSFLVDAPIVRTSATQGAGLDDLRAALRAQGQVAAAARAPRLEQPFRMPIDRVFSIPGHGTVVTGSVTHGRLEVGQAIQVLPEWPDREIRVRQLQTHDRSVQQVVRGQRAAVNLAGVSVEEVQRGFQLVAPGQLPTSDCLTVELTASEHFPEGIQDHLAIRLHLATSVVLGKVRFLQPRAAEAEEHPGNRGGATDPLPLDHQATGSTADATTGQPVAGFGGVAGSGGAGDVGQESAEVLPTAERPRLKSLPPGHTILAQLLLDRPVLANWGQRMVIRRPSPVETLGQAVVLDPCLPRLSRPDGDDLRMAGQLTDPDPVARLQAALYFSWDGRPPGPSLRNRLAIPEDDWPQVRQVVLDSLVAIPDGAEPLHYHPWRLAKLQQQILKFLDQQHTLQPKRWFIDRQAVQRHLHFVSPQVVRTVLKQMQQQQRLRHSASGVGLPDRGPQLTRNQAKLIDQLLQQFRAAGLQPPTIEQCIEQAPKNKQDVVDLLKMASESGDLVRIDPQTYLAAEALEQVWRTLQPQLVDGQSLTVSQIRDLLQITRKLAVPLCEYLDQVQWTLRQGDLRGLGPQAPRLEAPCPAEQGSS
jgi:translation elongation factor TU